jgi:magnesium-transporting ATPase (P-type)
MSQNLDLKAIERKAFRSVHQDGLWDIYLGGLLLVLSLLFAIPEGGQGKLTYMGLALLGVAIVFSFFQLGKKYITIPRMGQVRFGPERQKRKATLAWIMSLFVLVTLALFLYSLYVWNVSAAGRPVDLNLTPSLERAVVASIAALIAGLSTIVISYFKEFTRGYYIALLMGGGFFFTLWLDSTVPMIAAGALILLPGLIIFIYFLRQHPLPPREASHDLR